MKKKEKKGVITKERGSGLGTIFRLSGKTRQVQHVDWVNINPRGNPSIQFETIVDHLLLSALAPSTNTQYQHHVQACFDFVKYKLEINWVIPLSLDCIAHFLFFLYQRGNSYSIILTYMSALPFYHKIKQQKDPTNTFSIKKNAKWYQKQISESPGFKTYFKKHTT